MFLLAVFLLARLSIRLPIKRKHPIFAHVLHHHAAARWRMQRLLCYREVIATIA
jgi:hypothetical protein